MKRIIITANSESMRAFRLRTKLVKDRLNFYLTEIEVPNEPQTQSDNLDVDARLQEMANQINAVITSEESESWVITAPLATLTRILPDLDPSVAKRLVETKCDDLTSLPAIRLVRRFAPAPIAA